MALIDELKEKLPKVAARRVEALNEIERQRQVVGEADMELADLDRAIAALEAPAQPLDELRSVTPATEEESGDQFEASAGQTEEAAVRAFSAGDDQSDGVRALPGGVEESRDQSDDWTPTVQPAELTVADLDKLATKATDEERAEAERDWRGVYAEPEIPEGFTRHDGGECPVAGATPVDVIFESGVRVTGSHEYEGTAGFWTWPWDGTSDRILYYRILEAPAPEQDASVEIEPTTDLWQQGYDDRKNGFEPSLAEPDYLKGYEARKAVEDEQAATYEQAKFCAEGMMADADRHAQDQRGIVGVITGMFKREREDA